MHCMSSTSNIDGRESTGRLVCFSATIDGGGIKPIMIGIRTIDTSYMSRELPILRLTKLIGFCCRDVSYNYVKG